MKNKGASSIFSLGAITKDLYKLRWVLISFMLNSPVHCKMKWRNNLFYSEGLNFVVL